MQTIYPSNETKLTRDLEIARKLHSQEKLINEVLRKKIRTLEKEIERLKNI